MAGYPVMVQSFLGSMSMTQGDFWPRPEVTDSSVNATAALAELAAVAVATINTAMQLKIADMQWDIANKYYHLAFRKWKWFKDTYMPCETAEMLEICNMPEYEKRYDSLANEYISSARTAVDPIDDEILRIAQARCLCFDPKLTKDFALLGNMIETDSGNFAYRYEEARKIRKDDLRWNRRSQSLNRGRDIQSNAVKYGAMAVEGLDNSAATFNNFANGASRFLGYFGARQDTNFPGIEAIGRPANSLSSTPRTLGGYTNNPTPFTNDNMLGGIAASQAVPY